MRLCAFGFSATEFSIDFEGRGEGFISFVILSKTVASVEIELIPTHHLSEYWSDVTNDTQVTVGSDFTANWLTLYGMISLANH